MKRIRALLRPLGKAVAVLLLATGVVAALMIVLAFTTAPFWTWYRMGVKEAGIRRPPAYIVVLGGGGMPSESALMRTWYAAKAAGRFTRAGVVIAMPGDTADPSSTLRQMESELLLRDVAPERIILADSGANTRAQALFIASRLPHDAALLLVTSPEHLLRSVLSFRKAGFTRVDGLPAFAGTLEANLDFTARKLGSRPWVPDVGGSLTIRYQFWMQMEYEFLVLRESLALAYYKLQGWI